MTMGAFGIGSYALLSGWLGAKEADKPFMERVRTCCTTNSRG